MNWAAPNSDPVADLVEFKSLAEAGATAHVTMIAEGEPLYWVEYWQVHAFSRFLRSSCCDAPVWSSCRLDSATYPVHCTACGQLLAEPGYEDLPKEAW